MRTITRVRMHTNLGLAAIGLLAMTSFGFVMGCESSTWEDDPYYNGRAPTAASSATPPSGSGVGSTSLPPGECVDSDGFNGHGCFKCTPTTNDELLNACTDSKFESFSNAQRIPGWSPLGAKPAPAHGAEAPPFTGGSTGSNPLPPAPACPLTVKPNPVMMLGGTGFPMETIAKAMGPQVTIFYLEKGSCEGVASMILNDPKLSGEVVYYDQDGTKNRCMLQESHPADIALSAVFAQSCANQDGLSPLVAMPPDVQDFLGPVSTVMFAVPATSGERAISADAAYRVYALGNSNVAPWNDEMFVFRRRASSGNQQTVALTLGLPIDGLRGRDSNGSSNMLNALRTSESPQGTIGISSSEIVDTNRDVMKALAYQHYNQQVAFYPDSDPGKLDRKNVRDGHYFMWMPLHVMTRTSAGDPVAMSNAVLDPTGAKKAERDAAVKRLVYVMVNRQEAPNRAVDIFGALKRSGNVPQCAMHVSRSKEGAPLEPYTPSVSCGCAFEAAAPGEVGAECKRCKDSSECTNTPNKKNTCSFGFCE